MMSSASRNANIHPHRIFVRNLPPNTSEDMLRAYFNRMGSVVDVLRFHDSYGVPLDLAIVSFRDACTADFFDQKRFHDFFGCQIETVELLSTEAALAMPQPLGDARSVDGDVSWQTTADHRNLHPGNSLGIFPTPQPPVPPGMSKDTIIVLRLRPKITKEVLQTHFSQFGAIKNVAVTRKGKKSKSSQRLHGFVTFENEENVRDALLLNDEDDEAIEETFHEILGVKVQVKRARS